jgi:hypothetical protein
VDPHRGIAEQVVDAEQLGVAGIEWRFFGHRGALAGLCERGVPKLDLAEPVVKVAGIDQGGDGPAPVDLER